MESEVGTLVEPTRAALAVTVWAEAQDAMLATFADEVGALDDLAVVELFRKVERVRNRAALVDHVLIGESLERGLAERLTQPSMVGVLAWALRLSRGEAARRVRAAEQLGARRAVAGEELEPFRPALAAAQRAGDATPEQVDICLRALDAVDHRGFDAADVEIAEGLLAQFATTFPPTELRQLATGVVERIDPDGTVPDEDLQQDRRHVAFRKRRDGSWHLEGRLTGVLGAKLSAVLGPLSSPRPDTTSAEDEDGEAHEVGEPDERHHGQRTHDALEEVCDRLLRSGTLPDSGGTPATLVVTVDEADLEARRGHGTTTDGTVFPMRTVLRLVDQADLVTTVLSTSGGVCDYGRTRRCASPGQTAALVARDRGCSFPGCSRPPEWCERHHVIAWIDGGRTSLDNLTLLCSYHHHSFEARGWTCRMADGLPTWTPPRWVDPHQRPLRNHRIRARSALGRGQPLRC